MTQQEGIPEVARAAELTPEPPPPPAETLSVAGVVFLFADMFVAPLPAGKKGTRSYSTGVVVDRLVLAQMMIAVGLARLHVGGAAVLTHTSRKHLGMTFNHVDIRLNDGADLHGLPPRLVRALSRDKKASADGASVEKIVERAVEGAADPYVGVIRWGIDEAVAGGYLDRTKSGGILGIGAKVELVPHAERIAEVKPRARELTDMWIRFRNTDADLAQQLRAAVGKGIEARERERESVFDG